MGRSFHLPCFGFSTLVTPDHPISGAADHGLRRFYDSFWAVIRKAPPVIWKAMLARHGQQETAPIEIPIARGDRRLPGPERGSPGGDRVGLPATRCGTADPPTDGAGEALLTGQEVSAHIAALGVRLKPSTLVRMRPTGSAGPPCTHTRSIPFYPRSALTSGLRPDQQARKTG